jgi:hypothetical protein
MSISKTNMDVCLGHGADGKPRQGQRIGRVTLTESRQYLDREDFLFLLLRTEGVTES